MTTFNAPQSAWRLDRGFWIYHVLLPLAAASLLLGFAEFTDVDLWLADRWYALEGHAWALRDHWLAYGVLHHEGKRLLIVLWLAFAALLASSWRVDWLRHWRRPLAYLVTCMVLLPAALSHLKQYSPVPCPKDLHRYGGELLYQQHFGWLAGAGHGGHCFPSGHASGGFALLAVYFAALPFARRPAWFLLPGLLVGWAFALGQQARGMHFLSHDLWTLGASWFGALALFLLFRPQTWPGPGPVHASVEP